MGESEGKLHRELGQMKYAQLRRMRTSSVTHLSSSDILQNYLSTVQIVQNEVILARTEINVINAIVAIMI
jgi:hypothetical protein